MVKEGSTIIRRKTIFVFKYRIKKTNNTIKSKDFMRGMKTENRENEIEIEVEGSLRKRKPNSFINKTSNRSRKSHTTKNSKNGTISRKKIKIKFMGKSSGEMRMM